MLDSVHGHIIDGERWIAERLRFLRERLGADPSDAERRVIESEIEVLSKERGITRGGLRFPPFLRGLRRQR